MQVWFESLHDWLDVPDDLPKIVRYNNTQPYHERFGPNAGCPEGYVMEVISDGMGGNRRVCRLADHAYVTDPSIRERETANTWTDYLLLFGGAVADPTLLPRFFTEGLPQVLEYVARLAGQTAGAVLRPVADAAKPVVNGLAVLAIAVVAILLLSKR